MRKDAVLEIGESITSMGLVKQYELPVPDGVEFSVTPERLEISYRLQLHTLKTGEIFVFGFLTFIAAILLGVFPITASPFLIIGGALLIAPGLYLIACHTVNRWFVSIDSRDVVIDSGPLPAGVDTSFDLHSIQYVYISPIAERRYRVMARLVDGRAVKMLDSLSEEVARFIQRQIESNLPSGEPQAVQEFQVHELSA